MDAVVIACTLWIPTSMIIFDIPVRNHHAQWGHIGNSSINEPFSSMSYGYCMLNYWRVTVIYIGRSSNNALFVCSCNPKTRTGAHQVRGVEIHGFGDPLGWRSTAGGSTGLEIDRFGGSLAGRSSLRKPC